MWGLGDTILGVLCTGLVLQLNMIYFFLKKDICQKRSAWVRVTWLFQGMESLQDEVRLSKFGLCSLEFKSKLSKINVTQVPGNDDSQQETIPASLLSRWILIHFLVTVEIHRRALVHLV